MRIRECWTQTSHVIRRPDLVTPIFWVRPRDTCSTSVLSIGRRSGAEIPFPQVYTEDSGRECTFPEPKLIVPSVWGPDNSRRCWLREYFISILTYNISESDCLTSGPNCWNSSSWSSLTTSLHSGQWLFNSINKKNKTEKSSLKTSKCVQINDRFKSCLVCLVVLQHYLRILTLPMSV